MKLLIKKLGFEKAIDKEWIITNGLGGYASSTIIGTNTRKYHGLLVAPLDSPGKRHLFVSKVDESVVIDGQEHILYTNMCRKNITEGYKNQVSFEKEEIPTFNYNIEGVEIETAPAVYYNLQGVQVENPTNGVYIVKRGNKVTKELIVR